MIRVAVRVAALPTHRTERCRPTPCDENCKQSSISVCALQDTLACRPQTLSAACTLRVLLVAGAAGKLLKSWRLAAEELETMFSTLLKSWRLCSAAGDYVNLMYTVGATLPGSVQALLNSVQVSVQFSQPTLQRDAFVVV